MPCSHVNRSIARPGRGPRGERTRGDQGIGQAREDRAVRLLVNHVHHESIPGLHQHVQVPAMQLHPPRVVPRVGRVDGSHDRQQTLLVLAMRPDLVAVQVGGVQVRLGGVEDHAVDAARLLVGVVLDILVQAAGGGHGEDVAVAGVVVEGGPIHVVRGLLCRQHEDGAGVGVGACGPICVIINTMSHAFERKHSAQDTYPHTSSPCSSNAQCPSGS